MPRLEGRAYGRSYADHERIGLLVIPDEIVATQEVRLMLPPDVVVYEHRVEFEEIDTPVNRLNAEHAIAEATRIINRVQPRAIAFACTSGVSFAGAEWHGKLLGKMRSAAPGVPVFTAIDAVTRTLHAIGAKRIVVGSPYSDDVMEGMADILAAEQIEVISWEKLFRHGYPGPWAVMSTTPARVAEFACRIDRPDAECVFVSCAGLPSASVVNDVERVIGKPFLTSNTAVAQMLRESLSPAAKTASGPTSP